MCDDGHVPATNRRSHLCQAILNPQKTESLQTTRTSRTASASRRADAADCQSTRRVEDDEGAAFSRAVLIDLVGNDILPHSQLSQKQNVHMVAAALLIVRLKDKTLSPILLPPGSLAEDAAPLRRKHACASSTSPQKTEPLIVCH